MLQRTFRYRLRPTTEQADRLRHFASVTRLVYNLALEQRRDWWREFERATGNKLNFVSQGKQVTALRSEVEWIADVPSNALTQALRDLDRAFSLFFGGTHNFPQFRKKGVNDSFRIQAKNIALRKVNARWWQIRVPNLGWVRFRHTRGLKGDPLNVTISQIAGDWYASIVCAIEAPNQPSNLPAVGIDRGIANTLALSTGEMLSTTDLLHLDRRKKRAQRALARRVRGSNRYRKQRRRLASITAKIGRCRAEWRHKTTKVLVNRFGFAAIEDLKTKNMTRSGQGKRGLNRSILEQGWGAFADVLAYKLEERGGALVKVNPAYTSQTCSECGTIDKASRESQASFACRHCGFAAHADTNAAINILRRSTASMCVEDRDRRTGEARTINHAALAA